MKQVHGQTCRSTRTHYPDSEPTRAKTCTIILRGGAEQFIEETERSLHDAIMIVRRTMKNDAVVAGNSIFVLSLYKACFLPN
jgi:chaperonin GroEL (HSP60 family)